MKCSVIVPVYNMASDGKLEYCLESLVHQTLQDLEMIAVDDASTDNSLQILRRYEADYPEKFRVIHYGKNKRQGGAKNEGLKAARGEWIGFIDSDDWVTPDFYEKLIGKAEETGADVVGCDYSLVSEHTMQPGKVIQNNTDGQTGICTKEQHQKLVMRPGSMVIKVYRGSMIRENGLGFPEGIFYEDNCAGTVWMLYCRRFEKINEPLYYYYQHNVSTVHYISEEKCRDRMTAAELMVMECSSRGFLSEYRPEIEFRFAETYYITTLFSYMSGVKHRKLSFLAELRDGMKKYFPDFEKNPYYLKEIGEEERKLASLHQKSNLGFYMYYVALNKVRQWRKAAGSSKNSRK